MRSGAYMIFLPALAVPALLVLIAVSQLGRAVVQDISPWKGGGFGMFSTLDRPTARSLELYLEFEDHDRQFEPSPGNDLWKLREEALATIVPTDRYINSFLEQFEDTQWYCISEYDEAMLHRNRCMTEENARDILDELEPDSPVHELLLPAEPEAMRAEVWKVTYHAAENELTQEKITVIKVELDDGGIHQNE